MFVRHQVTAQGKKSDFYAWDLIACVGALYGNAEHMRYLMFVPECHYVDEDYRYILLVTSCHLTKVILFHRRQWKQRLLSSSLLTRHRLPSSGTRQHIQYISQLATFPNPSIVNQVSRARSSSHTSPQHGWNTLQTKLHSIVF